MINGEWNALQGPQVPDDTGTFQMDLHWKHPLGLSVWLGGMHRQLDLWQTSRSQRAFSPGLAYQHPSTNFLIRLQSMARLPSLLETYGRSFFLQGNADLKKERGLGVDLLWRSAHGRVSLYGRQVEDLIEWDQNAQFSSRPRNRAYAQVIGFSVFARRNGFQLGYRLQNTWAFDDEIDTQADELAGEPIHRLRLHWKGRWAHLSYGVHWDLKSGYYLDRANLRPVAPSYPVDLEMAYPLGQSPFRLSIRLSNLLNQRQHEVILLPSDHRVDLALADQAGYPLPGRRWFIGLETRR